MWPIRSFASMQRRALVTQIGADVGASLTALVVTRSGEIFGLDSSQGDVSGEFYQLDPVTGSDRYIGQTGRKVRACLAYDPVTDEIYGLGSAESGQTGLVRYDRRTGAATPIGNADLSGTFSDATWDPVGRRVIVFENTSDRLYALDPLTGDATFLSTTSAPMASYGLAYDAARGFLLDANGQGQLYRVDLVTGQLTPDLVISPTAYLDAIDSGGWEIVHTVNVGENAVITDRDFANQLSDSVSISGSVYDDLDQDGYRDIGELGVGGVTIYIDSNDNGALDAGETTATTAADGTYLFFGLSDGIHSIRHVSPSGFRPTSVGSGRGSYYATDPSRQLFKFNELTGSLSAVSLKTPSGDPGPSLHGSAFTNDGELYALQGNLSSDVLWKIDPVTGVSIRIGDTGQNHAWGMTYDAETDTIYGVAYIAGNVRLGTFDRVTGIFTAIPDGLGVPFTGSTGALTGTGGIAFDPIRRRIIAYDFHDGEIYAFSLDGSAQLLSQTIANLSGGLAFNGRQFVLQRRNLGSLTAIDPDTGTLTSLGVHFIFPAESLEYIPGSDASHLVLKRNGYKTFTGRNFGIRLNAIPVANDDEFHTGEHVGEVGQLFGDNGNGADTDTDLDPLTVTAVNGDPIAVGETITLASGALLTVNADGSFTLDSNEVFAGLAAGESRVIEFTYQISDGFGGTATATARLTFHGENDPPSAVADSASVGELGTVSGNLLANDTDPDGDLLVVTAFAFAGADVGETVTLPSGARLTVNADGTYLYDPAGAFRRLRRGEVAEDSFGYQMADRNGAYFAGHGHHHDHRWWRRIRLRRLHRRQMARRRLRRRLVRFVDLGRLVAA